MIESLRWPSAMPAAASTKVPLSSGPRWAMARLIASTRAFASSAEDAALASRKPAIPHTHPPRTVAAKSDHLRRYTSTRGLSRGMLGLLGIAARAAAVSQLVVEPSICGCDALLQAGARLPAERGEPA